MTFDPFISDAPLIVYIDFKSPYAFIARKPTLALAKGLGIDVDWRPLTLDIPSYLGSARLNDKGKVVESKRSPKQWAMVKYAYRDARRYAALQGYTLRGTVKIWDTSLAHIGMMWAKQHGESVLNTYIDNFYERFWRREVDAEDPVVIQSLLVEAGAGAEGFAAYADGDGRREHDVMQAAIFEAGVYGVPSYVVDGQLFFGREHLPMIQWLLTGGSGAAPDIAYRSFADE